MFHLSYVTVWPWEPVKIANTSENVLESMSCTRVTRSKTIRLNGVPMIGRGLKGAQFLLYLACF